METKQAQFLLSKTNFNVNNYDGFQCYKENLLSILNVIEYLTFSLRKKH